MSEMRKIAMILAYDGTDYFGFQRQKDLPSIQEKLEEALLKIHGRKVDVVGAGRTDAGVHAAGQVIHFTTPLSIPDERWPYAVNSLLPPDIRILKAYHVDDAFHARYSAIGKRYLYRIDRRPIPDVFTRRFAYHYPYPLDLDLMRTASRQLIGRHDFTSFTASGSSVVNHVRTLYEIEISEEERILSFLFRGDGFLYNMVRIMVGTLLEVGAKKRSAEEIPLLLQAKDRKKAGYTVPAYGLLLQEVLYPKEVFPPIM